MNLLRVVTSESPVHAGGENMKLFLSYAGEDGQSAREIDEWFRSKHFSVYRFEDPRQQAGRFLDRIHRELSSSDAFLVLLSPDSLRSAFCKREVELAILREIQLQTDDPDRIFIHVLKIAETPLAEAGFLQSYNWIDLTNPAHQQRELGGLADRLGSAQPDTSRSAAPLDPERPNRASPLFRNRRDELERVSRGLTNASGPHFWLVISPPQLGKTWFLNRLSAQIVSAEPSRWSGTLVDLRDQPTEMRNDAGSLLARIFELGSPVPVIPGQLPSAELRGIAQRISRSGKSHLCLLDSAELLEKETATALRACLGEIYHLVPRAGNAEVRVGFVVASRREEEWRGVIPSPRLSPLPLTEFTVDVVEDALRDLAYQMSRSFDPLSFRPNATLVHRLSEGLPALLIRCLHWIRREEWLDMERMESQELFGEIAHPYIRDGLLSPDSLFPSGQEQPPELGPALERAFRAIAPYRLFTLSHLRRHLESDAILQSAVAQAGLSIEDLWKAISGTALLTRPLDEPWQQIHSAIRRLLYRYYYASDAHRAEANREARRFVEVWADKQSGKEQIIGMVECLWHEVAELSLTVPADMEQRLIESARTRSQMLQESPAYTIAELRAYAGERLRSDYEFQEAIGRIAGLFDRLVTTVEP
jgi:hypothetical protein